MKVSMNTPQMLNQYYNNISNYNNINNNKYSSQNVSFGKDPSKFFNPLKKLMQPLAVKYNKFTDFLADGIAGLLEIKPVKAVITKTGNSKHMNNYLFTHITALTSVILSAFYMEKTLENKNLEEKKRRVLAINQGLVTAASTIMAYTLDIKLNKWYDGVMSKFEKINGDNVNLKDQLHGLKMLKTAVIFGTIYRFIAPVFVTPLANHIGNKLEEKEALKNKMMQKN